MRTRVIVSAVALSMAVFTSACTRPNQKAPMTDAEADRLAKAGLAQEAAVAFTELGERRVQKRDVLRANAYFEKALRADPSLEKATFYRSVLRVLLAFRGYERRVSPLLAPGQYSKVVDQLSARDFYSPLRELLADVVEKMPFRNLHDLQRFYRTEVLVELEAARQAIAGLKGPFELELDSQFEPYKTLKIDQHDLKVLTGLMIIQANTLRVQTAFSFKGYEALKRASERRGWDLPKSWWRTEILKHPEFLVLERDHQLAQIPEDATQMLRQSLDLAQIHREVCSRPSHLFAMVCFGAESIADLEAAIGALAGPRSVNVGNRGSLTMDLNAFFRNPPQDLKPLLPLFTAGAGGTETATLPDATFGGLFPKSEGNLAAEEVLAMFNPLLRLGEFLGRTSPAMGDGNGIYFLTFYP